MAAVLSPAHYGPAHGILINRSPSASPYHHPASLPPLVPSNPSLSSSTSSASDLATDSDYYSSSSATTSSRPGRPPHDAHEPKPRSGSAPNSRRIRFAPLPDPRRNVFIADDDNLGLPSVLLDDAADDNEQQPSQSFNASSAGKPCTLSLKDQDAKIKSAPSGSLLFSPHDHTTSGSTPTLASTATITPICGLPGLDTVRARRRVERPSPLAPGRAASTCPTTSLGDQTALLRNGRGSSSGRFWGP
ncbi:hypothetical protein EVJ58_g5464 [Rhodofomes roseus]|uniref:Uncharacterized protein n=1 Tax=Rhodofomes roseus TaxID=34475 RepID=A0A4Y9YG96_9APHY|nr:hypothetical protein EVJ58_g5464 [Rhodofomes roseus]